MGSEEECPWADPYNISCKGVVRLVSREQTTVGCFHGYDRNRRTDVFRCDTCFRDFVRHWSWELPKALAGDPVPKVAAKIIDGMRKTGFIGDG